MRHEAPDRVFLTAQVRWALSRGVPSQAAEDIVFASWERACRGFEPGRGSFEAYMQVAVRNGVVEWWRSEQRTRRAYRELLVLHAPSQGARLERVSQNQSALMEALDEDHRRVFAAWALQKQLGKGATSAAQVGASIGMAPKEFENAKRRLKTQLQHLLQRFGWTVCDLLYGGEDADEPG